MNNTFNVKRFGLVLNKDLQENGKRYLLSFLTLFGILAFILTWISYSAYYPDYSENILNKKLWVAVSFFFLGFGLFFTSTAMDVMNSKIKRIAYLSVPASNLEKYLSRWFIATIGYIIVFFIALWMADLLRVLICSLRFPEVEVKALDYGRLIAPGDAWNGASYAFPHKTFFQGCVASYFLLQSVFLLGTLFWQKNSFIKTFSISILFIISFILLWRWTVLIFYNDFREFGKVINSFSPGENFSDTQVACWMTCIFGFFTLFNWIIAYFRFRESEIIKRW